LFVGVHQLSFEIKDKDVLARIGKLKTKTGVVETPLMFPVINPNIPLVKPKRLKETFGFEAVITNAYIIKKCFKNKPIEQGLHSFVDFNGVVMTDSGAYQILVYGEVEVNQLEIVRYQERIGSDIATILDIPTGWKINQSQATDTVKETIKRAKAFFKTKTRDDILWVGPVQGGRHLDLVTRSAIEMSKLPFQIHALGSPTEVMENYRFDVLVDMIITAKQNLPPERPLHLFGAGHPFMFSLAVALGCDLFDSAAYALYARENRYMTESGTWRLSELEYFPCNCPNCLSETPQIVREKTSKEREIFLAEHNLYVCAAELRRIKQAIKDGRLWEHLEMRVRTHPALFTAFKKLKNHKKLIEEFSPSTKPSGLFFFDSNGLYRSEVSHYRERLLKRYCPPNKSVLLLAPQTRKKPFHKAYEFKRIKQALRRLSNKFSDDIHVCFYAAPFGVIPLELDEVYPLSQHEIALPTDQENYNYVASQVSEYVSHSKYEVVVLFYESQHWENIIKVYCTQKCIEGGIAFETIDIKAGGSKNILTQLESILDKHLRR
jgi:7-cyano-7-deazaguanine tRNA-ribosyltransferase